MKAWARCSARQGWTLRYSVALAATVVASAAANGAEPHEVATHKQSRIIQVESKPLVAFCLDGQDRILAAVATTPGKILQYSPEGELLATWELPVTPEALAVANDGTVYVAGERQILKLDADGNVLLAKPTPNADAATENAKQIREQVVAQAKQLSETIRKQMEAYTAQIEKLEAKESRTAQDEAILKAYQRNLVSMENLLRNNPQTQLSDEQIDAQVKRMSSTKTKISSISVSGENVFVACPSIVGYGFEVWKTTTSLEGGEKIAQDLRGCCGQMDVKACDSGVYVAENSRHRVVRYDAGGKQVTTWGERARTGIDGFTGCCNPMNVTFGPAGEIYTAESTSGRIKRYDSEGKLLGLVGSVDIVPGCKNVSIAVSRDGQRVYMLDITRNHLVLMTQQSDATLSQVE